MRNFKIRITFAILLAGVFLVACQAASAAQVRSSTKWEYKTLIISYRFDSKDGLFSKGDSSGCKIALGIPQSEQSEPCVIEDGNGDTLALLNQLGQEGWELVLGSPDSSMVGMRLITLIFKRPLP